MALRLPRLRKRAGGCSGGGLYAGRVFASPQLPTVMHILRDLCGCQVSLMPSKAMFDSPGAGDWLRKYFRLGEIPAEERRKLFVLARELLNSDYAGHRMIL